MRILSKASICLIVMVLLAVPAIAASDYKEAPMLVKMVEEGKLPPVEERLPKNPVIVPVIEEIGQYGGTATTLANEAQFWGDGELLIPREPPLRLAQGGESVEPNVIDQYEFSEDGKTFTFHLREGLKWSDGVELTTEDVMFWWEDVINNKELMPVVPQFLRPGGEPVKVTALDKYTIQMEFAVPNPVFTTDLAFWNGAGLITYWCKHYLGQFHPKYTSPEELDKKVKDAGFNAWYELFTASIWNQRGGATRHNPTQIPTLQPYMIQEVGLDTATLVRNPYYWKVDEEGNQLPYIDYVKVNYVESVSVMDLKRIAGEADLGSRGFPLANYSLLKENAEKGNYDVRLWEKPYSTDCAYQLNQTYEDDLVLRDIFRDKRFRIAMSLAMDREEISQLVYKGLAVPIQTTPHPKVASKLYVEEYAKAYTEHDPDEANRLLDEMGLKWDENHEWRLRPDGKRLDILLEYFYVETPKRQITEIATQQWAKVGIKVESKEITGAMVSQRAVGNQMQMGLWHGNRATSLLLATYPYWYLPVLGWEKTWCPLWAHWYQTDGAKGEEPPEIIKEAIRLWEQMRMTLDEEEHFRIGKEILKINAENLWTIGTVAQAPQPVIVRTNLKNVPEEGYLGWDVFQMDTYHPEQFFFKQ